MDAKYAYRSDAVLCPESSCQHTILLPVVKQESSDCQRGFCQGNRERARTVIPKPLHALLELLNHQLRVPELEPHGLLVELIVSFRAVHSTELISSEDGLEKVSKVVEKRVVRAPPAAFGPLPRLFHACGAAFQRRRKYDAAVAVRAKERLMTRLGMDAKGRRS